MEELALLVIGAILGWYVAWLFTAQHNTGDIPPTIRSEPTMLSALLDLVYALDIKVTDVEVHMPLDMLASFISTHDVATHTNTPASISADKGGVTAMFCGLKIKGLYP